MNSNASIKDAQKEGITTKSGLLFKNNFLILLPAADILANKYGFQYAEMLVHALEKLKKDMPTYKLTDENNQTRDHTQWGPGVTHTANGNGKGLCSDGWIHFYTNPLIAILMNPAHANFLTTRLWECETSGAELHVPLKSGCKTLKTVKEIPLPKITEAQKIAFGILSAKEVFKDKLWNSWADKWLSGEDRTEESAKSVANAVSSYAANATTWAVSAAAANAAWTAHAASSAANAATSAFDAADAAFWAADTNPSIDFIKLAEKALTYK